MNDFLNNDINYAPIVIFAYKRATSLFSLLNSLELNKDIINSIIHIFIDGPKNEKDFRAVEKTTEVANEYKKNSKAKSVYIHSSDVNKGLVSSIRDGVQQVFENSDRIIVLEDDLIISNDFISFMNKQLTKYQMDNSIFSIGGWFPPVCNDIEYVSIYKSNRFECWGWGTWKEQWNSIDWNYLLAQHVSIKFLLSSRSIGGDFPLMYYLWKKGHNQSWAIPVATYMFLQNKYCIVPTKSLVINTGFNNMGTNCSSIDLKQSGPISYSDVIHANELDLVSIKKMKHKLKSYYSFTKLIISKLRAITAYSTKNYSENDKIV